ncbi:MULTISPECIES: hypothetical protein [Pseudomonas]|uniref:Uncharacterized protein n=1 Tax=Pseudomonas gingeri TaxID=117681 RepID=A0A7Y7YDE5_9PSED|nr:hypothetical protein [Pseudomonas gingeri]NWA00992.1 hypothetical protein [Pseudomonas gingeri]NWA14097.1 hypothetical protein [Pseudomonas gingeri]NWA56517.1 hypothetical protein [Pseudomonas gingeri]NWA95011.1 hypothetical protein [Pseudomonas gingeri]NWB05093.1 hypothetical protein [Pseudomonas gingeri]
MKYHYMALALFFLPSLSMAKTPILQSLEAQGIRATALSDQSLSEIKGSGLIMDQPYPSVTQGMKIYNIRLKRFGNERDYRSYYSVGSEWEPHKEFLHYENGVEHKIAGDRWLADKSDAPGGNWSASNATVVDYHYQALNDNGTPKNFGFRESSWNRPVSTFSW